MAGSEASDAGLMRAVTLNGPGEYTVHEVQRPSPKAGEVLIRVAVAGICGTDLHIYAGEYGLAKFPLTPGHEFSGTIVEVGDGVRSRHVGERVTVDPNVPCMNCPECKRNAFNQCENLEVLGVTRPGAFAEFVVAPESVVYPIGDLPFAEAALIEPLACVAWGIERVRPALGDMALLFGAGPMGCLVLQALKAAGAARVAVIDLSPARLEVARTLGADLTLTPADTSSLSEFAPRGFEIVVDATGVPEVLENAVRHARAGGTVWVFGVAPETAKIAVAPYEIFQRDLSIVGSFAVNKTFQDALSLASSGKVRLAPLVSHSLPLEQFGDGLHLASEDPTRMKVQFVLSEGGDG